jgi:AcrR family transcriptional regulator
MSNSPAETKAPRRQRSDGARSRQAILREATRLVTVDGIQGLSISRLADSVGMSKSGLFAHFRSKEELQLATIETADDIFRTEVIDKAHKARAGLPRLRALCEAFLAHLERGVFPGGCFFASVAAEIDTHPGPVRDAAMASIASWSAELETAVGEAQEEGTLDTSESPDQIAFELDAYLLLANAQFVATADPTTLVRARHAIDRVLGLGGERPERGPGL